MCSTSQDSVPTLGPMCSDHFHPWMRGISTSPACAVGHERFRDIVVELWHFHAYDLARVLVDDGTLGAPLVRPSVVGKDEA
jgi:hypothetical protein